MSGDYTVVVDTDGDSYVGAQEQTYYQAELAARKLLSRVQKNGYVCIVTPLPNSRRLYAEKHCWELETEGLVSSLWTCTRCGIKACETTGEKPEEGGCFLDEQACGECTTLFWMPFNDVPCKSCGMVEGDGGHSTYVYCLPCAKRDNICRGCGNSLAQN